MTLHQEILAELAELDVDDRTLDLVMASLKGQGEVERVLAGKSVDYPTGEVGGAVEQASSVYFHDITVSGFRGIGPEVRLEVPPGPGLTVVVGRNGSGKSSFAEALELLLTGDTLRWKDRTRVWKEGWRNLHDGSAPRISARFLVEGKAGFTTVQRRWSENTELDEASSTAQHYGEKRTDLAGVGWDGPLELYRPLLPYNELGMIGARPSDLFDTLTKVLGLEPVDVALNVLASARLKRERLDKQVKKELKQSILPALSDLEEERAERASSLLKKRVWNLDALVRLGAAPSQDRDSLSKPASLRVPDEERVLQAATQLEGRYKEFSELAGTEVEEAERLARLLTMALEHHQGHDRDSCPVCGVGMLDSEWRASTERQVDWLRERASRYKSAKRRLRQAVDVARGLVTIPPIPATPAVGTTTLRDLWTRWAEVPDHPGEVPDDLLGLHEEVAREATRISEQAEELYSRKEEQWAAIFPVLMAWEQNARTTVASREAVRQIKKAEQALKNVSVSLRAARWQPIESQGLGTVGASPAPEQRRSAIRATGGYPHPAPRRPSRGCRWCGGASLGRGQPGGDQLLGSFPLLPTSHAAGEPVPVSRDRRPDSVDGSCAGRRTGSRSLGGRRGTPADRVHP